MDAALEAIRSTDHPRKDILEDLLHLSARHVSAAEFGHELDMRRASIPD